MHFETEQCFKNGPIGRCRTGRRNGIKRNNAFPREMFLEGRKKRRCKKPGSAKIGRERKIRDDQVIDFLCIREIAQGILDKNRNPAILKRMMIPLGKPGPSQFQNLGVMIDKVNSLNPLEFQDFP